VRQSVIGAIGFEQSKYRPLVVFLGVIYIEPFSTSLIKPLRSISSVLRPALICAEPQNNTLIVLRLSVFHRLPRSRYDDFALRDVMLQIKNCRPMVLTTPIDRLSQLHGNPTLTGLRRLWIKLQPLELASYASRRNSQKLYLSALLCVPTERSIFCQYRQGKCCRFICPCLCGHANHYLCPAIRLTGNSCLLLNRCMAFSYSTYIQRYLGRNWANLKLSKKLKYSERVLLI